MDISSGYASMIQFPCVLWLSLLYLKIKVLGSNLLLFMSCQEVHMYTCVYSMCACVLQRAVTGGQAKGCDISRRGVGTPHASHMSHQISSDPALREGATGS